MIEIKEYVGSIPKQISKEKQLLNKQSLIDLQEEVTNKEDITIEPTKQEEQILERTQD